MNAERYLCKTCFYIVHVYFWSVSLVALLLDVSGQNADNKILTRTV